MKDIASYQFELGKRTVLTEIYFPKKAVYQGAMYGALIGGLKEGYVRAFLIDFAPELYETELSACPHWFDPKRYEYMTPRTKPLSIEDIKRRMNMYKSPYFGWSLKEIDGVFLGKRKKMDDELTQVIRIIFKLPITRSERKAEKEGMVSVYRSLLYFAVDEYGKGGSRLLWSKRQQERFLDQYDLEGEEREFVEQYFRNVMRAVAKYLDDCGLFLFGYLVRKFWHAVITVAYFGKKSLWKGKLEDEIWVSSIFGVSVNVMKPIKPAKKKGRKK